MMLIVLNKKPIKAASLVPDKLKFKQLLELGQMICSCGYCDVYKKIPQGKEIQEWIKKNPTWIKTYAAALFHWVTCNIKIKEKTFNDLWKICTSIPGLCFEDIEIETAILRYNKEYKSIFPSNTEICIENAIEEYEQYLIWKGYNVNL